MGFQRLASQIAKREGKKSQARIGNIREILKIIAEMEAEAVLVESSKFNDYPVAILGKMAYEKYLKMKKRNK